MGRAGDVYAVGEGRIDVQAEEGREGLTLYTAEIDGSQQGHACSSFDLSVIYL